MSREVSGLGWLVADQFPAAQRHGKRLWPEPLRAHRSKFLAPIKVAFDMMPFCSNLPIESEQIRMLLSNCGPPCFRLAGKQRCNYIGALSALLRIHGFHAALLWSRTQLRRSLSIVTINCYPCQIRKKNQEKHFWLENQNQEIVSLIWNEQTR